MMHERLRAPFQYFGGKGHMTAKLASLVPPGGRPYVEAYCGAASLLFSREPASAEVLNDIDGDVVGFFRVCQNKEMFEELRWRLMWTPYSRAEFARAIELRKSGITDPVERAWAFFVAQNQGTGGVAETAGNWGRAFISNGGMAETSNKWLMRLSMLDAWRWRLMQVQIDHRDAMDVIKYWDTDEAVFYLDPPYHAATRVDQKVYRYEVDADHHDRLVAAILDVRGAVVLSGYRHPIYMPLEAAGWERVDFATVCYAAGRGRNSGMQGTGAAQKKVPRVESVWRNPRAVAMLPRREDARKEPRNGTLW